MSTRTEKPASCMLDKRGRYFMAEYHEDGRDRIRVVSPSVAAAFIEKYGTDIEKGPEN